MAAPLCSWYGPQQNLVWNHRTNPRRTEAMRKQGGIAGLEMPGKVMTVNVKVAYATHESPLPLAGEGSGERETVMTFMIGDAWKSHDR